MSEEDGLVYACVFDGEGGARELDWEGVRRWRPRDGAIWVHLRREGPAARRWLAEESGLDEIYVDALLAEETRPRLIMAEDNLLVILRGVNLNPGANPEEMISIRAWGEARRVITSRRRQLMAINDIRAALGRGEGPRGPGEFVAALAHNLIWRMAPTIAELDEDLDNLEDEVLKLDGTAAPAGLGDTRRAALTLRRYLAPQGEVLTQLQETRMSWLDEEQRRQLGEIADKTARYTEDLNLARERAAVIQDDANNRISQRLNRSVFTLTIVSTVLLPLGLVTGLLGINVGGIPGAENPWAFLLVVGVLAILAGTMLWLLRRFKLL